MSQFEEDIPPGVDFLSEDAARKWTEQAKENVVGFVVGWSLIAGSWRMAAYAAVLAIGFHLRVIFSEEPTLLGTAVWD